MAEEKGAAQKGQQVVIPGDAPFYTHENAPKDLTRSARWLFAKGWRCVGEPSWESAEWFAPGPDEEQARREPCMGYIRRSDPNDRDANGAPRIKYVREQLKAQDGVTLTGAPTVPITQLTVVMPPAAMNFAEAVRLQLARDAHEQRRDKKRRREQDESKKSERHELAAV